MKTVKHLIKQLGITLMMMFVFSALSFAQEGPNLIDHEIASVAVVANQIDISYAEIALKKSKNKKIQEFANRMVTDHNAVIQQAVDLVTKLSVTPKDNTVSQSLLKDAKKNKNKTKKS